MLVVILKSLQAFVCRASVWLDVGWVCSYVPIQGTQGTWLPTWGEDCVKITKGTSLNSYVSAHPLGHSEEQNPERHSQFFMKSQPQNILFFHLLSLLRNEYICLQPDNVMDGCPRNGLWPPASTFSPASQVKYYFPSPPPTTLTQEELLYVPSGFTNSPCQWAEQATIFLLLRSLDKMFPFLRDPSGARTKQNQVGWHSSKLLTELLVLHLQDVTRGLGWGVEEGTQGLIVMDLETQS